MKAAVLKDKGRLVVEDIAEPKAGPGDVVVRVAYCGICGTDVHDYVSDRASPGLVMGHEWSGNIVELGEGVEGWMIGDRVVVGVSPPCGTCPHCRQGYAATCRNTLASDYPRIGRTGAYAEYTAVKAGRLFRVPDEVTDEEAAVIEPIAVGFHGFRQSGMRGGDSVVIIGGGPIGLGTLQVAKLGGARSIFVAEKVRGRADLAKRLGADEVFDPSAVDVNTEVLRRLPLGAEVVFDCAAVGDTVQQAVELVRPGGHVLLVGLYDAKTIIDPRTWLVKEVSFRGALAYTVEEYHMVIELIRQRALDGRALISHIVPLSEIQDAFQTLLRPTSQVKVLVRP